MSARETLLAKLHERGDLAFFETPSSVRIEPLVPGGFCVTLATPDDREAIVFLGDEGFHQHFDEEDEALDFIAWCFSGEARLRESWRGETLQKIDLETLENGNWTKCMTYGLLIVPYWRNRTERILHNPKLSLP